MPAKAPSPPVPRWTAANDATLRTLYPTAPRETILRELPGRTWEAIKCRAVRLGVSRGVPFISGNHVVPFDPESPVVRSDLLHFLRRPRTVEALTTRFRCSGQDLITTVDLLRQSGYQIKHEGDVFHRVFAPPPSGTRAHAADLHPLRTTSGRFGVVSDTHLGSRFARLDVLEAAYDHFAEVGVKTVYHAGNIVDGECSFNRHDLLVHGITDQALYVLDNYPQRKGIQTLYITADDHEGWWQQREGIDFGRYLTLEAERYGRHDLKHIGYMEADLSIHLGSRGGKIRLMHPGGGTAYALSYTTQKIVESLSGGEKPSMLIVGHYHKALYHYVRNVHVIQAGTTCDQTTFMRKKSNEAHVGFWTIDVRCDTCGAIRSVKCEFTAFFDRSYHQRSQP